MVLTVTEDTPADMLAGSMELLVQLPREHHLHTQRVTVQRSTPMMDLLVQIATAHKLAASSYTLQAIGERGLVLPHQPNTPIGALDALQVKLLPKQGTFVPRKTRQANQPFETTFRLQVHLPRNQLYVSRVSPKMNLGDILDEVCREKNLDRNKYELRHPANLEETLDLSLSLQDYHLQEVTLYAKQGRTLGSALSSQDIMALQRQEERRRQQAKQSVFGFMFKKSKESSLSTDSLGGRSVSPARSDETGRSASPLQPPARPQRKRRPAPKPPVQTPVAEESNADSGKDKMVISHSRNSSDSSGYHEASVLSDNPESARLPETLPRRSRAPGAQETPRKLAHTSQSSKSLGNLATTSSALSHGTSSTSLSSTGLRKKRAAPPPPPAPRPLSSAVSTQALERIVDSEESLTSDMDHSKPPSDIGAPSKASSDIDDYPKANSDVGVSASNRKFLHESTSKVKSDVGADRERDTKVKTHVKSEPRPKADAVNVQDSTLTVKTSISESAVADPQKVDTTKVAAKRDSEGSPSDTDILLQKVSDTLTNSLPISKSTAASSQPHESRKAVSKNEIPEDVKTAKPTETGNVLGKREIPSKTNEQKKTNRENDTVDGTVLNASTPNITSASQQDTSDYVSAVDEDLSISDWEYQLPAPPSAFRDTNSPVFDGYDTITLRSVEAFKEPDPVEDKVETAKGRNENRIQQAQNSEDHTERPNNSAKLEAQNVQKAAPNADARRTAPVDAKNYTNAELKKEIISELESKLETGSLPQPTNKDVDPKRMEKSSAPKIAPVDNTLSNFTITTYARPKSIDIFDDTDPRPGTPGVKRMDERVIKTFATMPRNEIVPERINDGKSTVKKFSSTFDNTQTVKDAGTNIKTAVSKQTEPKISKRVSNHRSESVSTDTERVNIQRSKSYISITSNEKYKSTKEEDDENVRCEMNGIMRKSTSINNLNTEVPRSNEKFSHWRDNILKRQEEPTKEKQLQSLQVLKSILPQLKNAQQAEESVLTESNNTPIHEDTRQKSGSSEHSAESNVVSTREQVTTKSEPKPAAQKEASTKRYTYAGPPTINLGSWSERPSSNVQIKMDTDYKFGKSNATGAKTIVNLNGSDNRNRDTASADNVSRETDRTSMRNESAGQETKIDKKEPDELTKKLITHTTALGFKKPSSMKVGVNDVKSMSRHDDRPVVTGVELKKAHTDRYGNSKDTASEIDTTPVNFKELTKAFGQDICLRAKPKRAIAHRHSDFGVGQSDPTEATSESNTRRNGHIVGNKTDESDVAKCHTLVKRNQSSANPPTKRFTSVVGIHASSQNTLPRNGIFSMSNGTSTTRINGPMPIVKGFKIQAASAESKASNVYVHQNGTATDVNKNVPTMPKPPTMPVITGVTLKSTSGRPKSMPVNVDSRDNLLESIRNFGGRENLKSAAARY